MRRDDSTQVIVSATSYPLPNKARILHALRSNPGLSKITLARKLRLGSGTVSVLTSELEKLGFVVAGDFEQSTGGRPAQQLQLNPAWPLMLAIDLGGTAAGLGVVNIRGELIERQHRTLASCNGNADVHNILQNARELA